MIALRRGPQAEYATGFNLLKRLALILVPASLALLAFLPSLATAANPLLINFQGKVVNANGTNVADNTGTGYPFTFKLYTVSSGGAAIWTETKNVKVQSGIFQTELGDTTSLSGIDFNANPNLYLGITFNNDAAGEMTPRVHLDSVPYAFNSDKLNGLDSTAFGQLALSQTWTGTNTFQPTTNIPSVTIKQTSAGSPTADIFNLQTANGTTLIQATGPVANESALTVQSVGATRSLTLNSGSGTIILGSATTTLQKAGTGLTLDTTSASDSTLTITNSGGGNGYLSVEGGITAAKGALVANISGDVTATFTLLDGSTTTNGTSGLTPPSTTLVLTNAANFDVGNYVQINDTNCGGTGVNPCYAKITAKAANTLTISPGLTWTSGVSVKEYHIPELGGIDLSQALANRYGRGYFIAGVATGNGTTYYTENGVNTSLATYSIVDSSVTTLTVGSAATAVSIGASGGTVTLPGSLSVSGTISGAGPTSGTSGYLQRSGTTISPATAGDSLSTTGTVTIQPTFNPSGGGTQKASSVTLTNAPTTTANTAVGQSVTVSDATALADTLQGLSISVSDTGSGAKTVTGLVVDTTGTTNASATVTTALFKTENSATAFVIQDGGGTPVLTANTVSDTISVVNLAITGALKLGNSSTPGYVLTSDASGNATWQQLPVSTVYGNSGTSMTGMKIWSGSATTSAGTVTINVTSDGTATGTALFSNIYAAQVTTSSNQVVPNVPLASIKTITANKTFLINVVIGSTLGAFGGATQAANASATTVYLTVYGN